MVHFVPSPYLQWFPKYEALKCSRGWWGGQNLDDPVTYFLSRKCVCESSISKQNCWLSVCHWPAHRCPAWGRSVTSASETDIAEGLKIILLFTRRYLDDGKSCRRETKFVAKGEVPCFQPYRSHSQNVDNFGELGVQSFSTFNTLRAHIRTYP